MIFKNLKEKCVKPDRKSHWVIIIGGFVVALTFLALALGTGNPIKDGLIAASLFFFGVAFNQLVTWLEFQEWEEGATALLVVVGVGYTISLIAVLIGHFTILLWCFAASGTPMVVGSWIRYATRREQERQEARNQALERLGNGPA
jgi:hypothetical protein